MATKHCRGCGQTLPAESFHKNKCQTDGLQSQCKPCMAARSKKWSNDNRERERDRQRRAYAADPERHNSRKRKWREDNPEKCKEIAERYKAKHPGARAKASRKWAAANREKRREIVRAYYKKDSKKWAAWARDYRNASPDRILHGRISAQLRGRLKGAKAGNSAFELLGYSLSELKLHLERQFTRGMSWDNMGKWHIDHIVPLSSFPLGDVRDAWALTNLRPLWAVENREKHANRTHLI